MKGREFIIKKVLFISNILSHIYAFHLPYLQWFRENGFEVHVMTNAGGQEASYCDKLYDIDIERAPFSPKNINALKQARKIINEEKYDIVHCHTPMGGVIGRIASRGMRNQGAKVLYTAHGFHFYKGAPLINWMLYYTMEKYLAHMTDCIITINGEDYERAKKHFQSQITAVEKSSGIGVNIDRFSPAEGNEKETLKKKYGYEGKFILLYAAEFIKRKNHRFFIEAASELASLCPNIKILFAGKGELLDEMKKYAEEKSVSKYIDFLGYCTNMPELFKMSDLVVSASIEEGFGINVIEGMAAGLPAVVSVVRGHKEMVVNGENGFLFSVNAPNDFCRDVSELCNSTAMYKRFSEKALLSVQKFSISNSLKQMVSIYKKFGV